MKPFQDEEKPFLSHRTTRDHSRSRGTRSERWLIMLLVPILVLSILANLLSLLWPWTASQLQNRDGLCASHIEQYDSPILDDVSMTYHIVRFNGSVLKSSIFRDRASPEVDAAWDSIGASFEGLWIPESDAERYGLDPRQVKRKPEQGGGFAGAIEGFHHLHCLNLLRQTSYYSYDYYRKLGKGAFENHEPILEKHVGHCLDNLRQQLMCTFDTSVFGQWWVNGVIDPDVPEPWVDFNTLHKCKNFDPIYQWGLAHDWSSLHGDVRTSDVRVSVRPGDLILPEIP